MRQLGGLKFVIPLLDKYSDRILLIIPRYLIINLKDSNFNGKVLFSEQCTIKYLKKNFSKFYLKKLLISACYMKTNEKKFEKECLEFALFKGLEIIQFFDACYGYEDRIIQTNGRKIKPNKILVLDLASKNELIKLNFNYKSVYVIGNPFFETIKNIKKSFDETSLLFISQPVKKDMNYELGYTERDIWKEIKRILYVKNSLIKKVYYKTHPREDLGSKFFNEIKDKILNDDQVKTFSGTVVGMFSSKMIEFFLEGRNVVSFKKKNHKNLCFLGTRKLIKQITSIEEIDDIIYSYKTLKKKEYKNIFKNSLKNLENALSFNSN